MGVFARFATPCTPCSCGVAATLLGGGGEEQTGRWCELRVAALPGRDGGVPRKSWSERIGAHWEQVSHRTAYSFCCYFLLSGPCLKQDRLVQLGTCRGLSYGREAQLSIMGERMTIALLCSWRRKGWILPVEEGEPRPWHIAFVYLVAAFLLQVSSLYFVGRERTQSDSMYSFPLHMFDLPRGCCSKEQTPSLPPRSWLPMTQCEAGLLRRLAHRDGPCRDAGLG